MNFNSRLELHLDGAIHFGLGIAQISHPASSHPSCQKWTLFLKTEVYQKLSATCEILFIHKLPT